MAYLDRSQLILLSGGAAVGLIIGVLVGHLATSGSGDPDSPAYIADQWAQDEQGEQGRRSEQLMRLVSTDNIADNLRELTQAPHLAGSERDEELAALLERRFRQYGFDDVTRPARSYLLSRPDPSNPNLVRLHNPDNATVFQSNYKELPLHEGDDHPDFVHAFNAYTPRGDVWSAVGEAAVYVNYGRMEDFRRLQELGVSVEGRLALVRYGKIFRGNKVAHAAQFGATGVILFSDPDDVARGGQAAEDVYPHSIWLPGTGMQRGTTMMGNGDPLTPGWPSTDTAHRIPKEDAGLPTIPAQPIGYADARAILEKLGGPVAPDDWQGGLEGVQYRLGPEMAPEFESHRLRLTSNNEEVVVKSYNVIASIRGGVEPDRYVFVGNHRDAWGYGASDPSSGTAQLLETARIFGQLLKKGWRPRRTLVFCSWGAEEYGLIGSTEWVEEHEVQLQQRAVAYVNTDTCASGPHVQLKASPLLWGLMRDVAGKVPGVLDASKTLLDEWVQNDKLRDPEAQQYPVMRTLGSGSDYAAFLFFLGIPSMDVWFRQDQSEHKGTYPSYHTGYETFFMVSNNTDPGFRAIQGCSRLALVSLKMLADSRLLPFSISDFPRAMKKALDAFDEKGKSDIVSRVYPKYKHLVTAVEELQAATERFEAHVIEKGKETIAASQIRMINDQLMAFERAFLLPEGLPNRSHYRHAVFAPSQFDSYAAAGFPGISDLLHEYEELEGDLKAKRDEDIRRHVNFLTVLTQRAAAILEDPTSLQ